MAENIYQKLLAVQKATTAIAKDAESKGTGEYKFEYVSSGAVLRQIRSQMDDQG